MVDLPQNIPDSQPVSVKRTRAKRTPPAEAAKAAVAIGMPKTIRILLEENDNIGPGGQYFGHNGRGYLVYPGREFNAPMGIINILNDAVMSTAVIDPVTRKVVGWREKLRYPYRVIQPLAA